ncbi:uncharacterized protein LOC143444005 isoform X1 [Arvicanthis niloticus]|uniref:uncharacterized protein LOC143314275 n=1 Tax=Arvicanthis niloticus TaxID=61156 RepID=UPI00402B6139
MSMAMAGWKERGWTSGFPQVRREERARRGDRETQSCRGDLPKCRWKRKAAHSAAAGRCLGQQDQWDSQKQGLREVLGSAQPTLMGNVFMIIPLLMYIQPFSCAFFGIKQAYHSSAPYENWVRAIPFKEM